MEANSIFQRWDDLVFQNRNKQYGAYPLRRDYSKRVLEGMGTTVVVILVLLIIFFDEEKQRAPDSTVVACTLNFLPPPIIESRQLMRRRAEAPVPVERSPRMVVTRDPVEEREEPEETQAAVITDEGDGEGAEGGFPEGVELLGSFGSPDVIHEDPEKVHDIAEEMPYYEGGSEAMMKFIQKKIRYPRAARDQRIEGTVYVRFVVNGDGRVSNVQVLRGIHPDCDREAVRVISMLPAWKGGKQAGRPVPVRMVLPIKFNVQ